MTVVLLPGGKAVSPAASRPWQLANLRILLLQRALRRRLPRDVRIERVRYRVRGWNGSRRDPVHDAAAALDRLNAAVPVVLVGHSMGGRVAAHLASRSEVVGIVALAPWWPADDTDLVGADTRLVVLHGTADTWTDPKESERQCTHAASRGVEVCWMPMAGSGHFMLRHAVAWHRITAEAVAQAISV